MELTIKGFMYNVMGCNVVLQSKLSHEPVKFFSKEEFYKFRDRCWNKASYVHECVRDIRERMIDIYYLKSNMK